MSWWDRNKYELWSTLSIIFGLFYGICPILLALEITDGDADSVYLSISCGGFLLFFLFFLAPVANHIYAKKLKFERDYYRELKEKREEKDEN